MGTMRDAVDTALSSAALPPWAAPGAELARRYADLVDEGEDVVKLGPRIMAIMRDLGLSAAAQGGPDAGGPEGGDDHDDELEELADRARQRRAAARHAAIAGADA